MPHAASCYTANWPMKALCQLLISSICATLKRPHQACMECCDQGSALSSRDTRIVCSVGAIGPKWDLIKAVNGAQ